MQFTLDTVLLDGGILEACYIIYDTRACQYYYLETIF